MRWEKNNWVFYIKLGNSLVKKLNETLGEGRELTLFIWKQFFLINEKTTHFDGFMIEV